MTDELLNAMTREVSENPHTTAFSKVSAIVRAASQLFGNGFRMDSDSVVATAQKVWNTTVVPYDIPYVPEFVERPMENVAWAACEQGLRLLVKQFEGNG